MKKFLSLALIMVFALSASAQKGSFYLGTSGMSPFGSSNVTMGDATYTVSPMTGFSLTTYKTGVAGSDDATTTNWGLAPEIGYFVSDNIAVGLGLYYTSSSYDSGIKDADAIALNTFGINPYARYYFATKGAFRVYGQANFVYASAKADTKGAESTDFFSVGIKPGISYNLSDRCAINATFGNLGYEDMKDNYSEFGLNLNMNSLQFGLSLSF